MTDNQLAEELKLWFNNCSKKQRIENPVWKVLKSELRTLKHWKNHERGDPEKGYIEGIAKSQAGNNYEDW